MRTILVLSERLWLPSTLVLALAIAVLSLSQPMELPLDDTPQGDKIRHLVAYALLSVPAALVMASARALTLWIGVFLVFGGAIELLQPFVGRTASWADLAANSMGIAGGTILGRLLRAGALRRHLRTST